jgi:aminocarboxymuconate-semialdehyde decarboxylase
MDANRDCAIVSDAQMPRDRVVDFHAHLLHRDVLAETATHSVALPGGQAPVPPPGTPLADAQAKMLDPVRHLEDMDVRGIDVEVLSAVSVLVPTGWADGQTALRLNRTLNDTVAAWVRRAPSRFVGTFTLPLQDLALALAELERAVRELDLRVANLPAQINGTYLGDPGLRPLWDAISDLDLVAFIHPDGVTDPWFQRYALWNSVGQPIEESKVLASLIYEGVLEDLPGLRIVVSHGGGYLPHYFGRLDRNMRNVPETMEHISRPPSEYLRDLYYDTCVYDPAVLEALVRRVGADRLVLGSDYPVGEPDPLGFVNRCAGLAPHERAMVTGTNAIRLLSRS